MPLPPLTVFDVETTGLDPKKGHRIVELAGIRIEGGRMLSERTFHSLVNPERTVPWETKQIHHIGDEELRDAPTIMTVLPQFLTFSEGSVLMAHNASFDRGFLDIEKEFCWGYVSLPEILCTKCLSQALFPMLSHYNLDTLCERFKITIPVKRHRALPDVLLAGEVLLKMLEAGRITSLEELRRKAGLEAPTLVPSPRGRGVEKCYSELSEMW